MPRITCRTCKRLSKAGRATAKYASCSSTECCFPKPDWIDERFFDAYDEFMIFPDDGRGGCEPYKPLEEPK